MKIALISNMQSYTKIFLSVLLMIACSQITIPIQPVPITLQTLAVLLIGLSLKPKEAFFTVLSYVALGLAGSPVFTGFHSGVNYLTGFTTGYLIGFIFAAPAIAYLREKITSSSTFAIFSICVVGQLIIYTLGVSWLAKSLGLEKAVTVGIIPFIIPEIIKSFMLTILLKAAYVLRR